MKEGYITSLYTIKLLYPHLIKGGTQSKSHTKSMTGSQQKRKEEANASTPPAHAGRCFDALLPTSLSKLFYSSTFSFFLSPAFISAFVSAFNVLLKFFSC